jgi:hypothetical protein
MNMATSTSLPFKPVPIVLKPHHWLEDVLQEESSPSRSVSMGLGGFFEQSATCPVSGKVLVITRHLELEVIPLHIGRTERVVQGLAA